MSAAGNGNVRRLAVLAADDAARLDAWLARQFPAYSRAFLQKWIRAGRVDVEGVPGEPNQRLKTGQVVAVQDMVSEPAAADTERPNRAASTTTRVPILFEDEALLVIDKPAGLVVHPAPSYRGETLVDWLRAHLGGKVARHFTDPERLGLVHRLDKDTSGVLLIAKSVPAQVAVARQFHDRLVRKIYAAWVQGAPKSPSGTISAPVGRSHKDPTRMTVSGSGRASETGFEVEESLKEVALLTFYPKTGRTHQIRVHSAAMGHPIVGDVTYGASSDWGRDFGIKRPLLHARRLEIVHPLSQKPQTFSAGLPADFQAARRRFRAAFAALAVTIFLWPMRVLAANEVEPVKRAKTSAKPAGSASNPSVYRAMRREVDAMKAQLESLRNDMDTIKDQMSAIESGLTQLDAARRLRDLERALPDMNSKLTVATNNAEDARSQAMDASRKVQAQIQAIEGMRDQLDKIQRQLIQKRAHEELQAGGAAGGGPTRP